MPRTGLSRPDTARSRVSTARPGTSRASSSRATAGTWVVAISEGRSILSITDVGREVGIAAGTCKTFDGGPDVHSVHEQWIAKLDA
ncbi:hypothetical protein FRB91_008101 [Serendipita sp. 411]|nr:hypothetical protein FRB91_008101 [Serendipita sp. 411]